MKLELANLKVEMLHHDPIVYTVEGIISDSECKHFIETSSKKVRRSLVSGFDQEKNKRGLLDNRRTSSSCWISHIHDEITQGLAERISELVNIPLSRAESFQVLHYADKQEYQPHLDTFDPSVKEYSHYLENGGQRILTAIGYLNDVIEGGETTFPNIKKKVQPKKGKIVVFDLCYKGTDKPNPDSFHGALPVLKGEKWAFNLWFREKEVVKKI